MDSIKCPYLSLGRRARCSAQKSSRAPSSGTRMPTTSVQTGLRVAPFAGLAFILNAKSVLARMYSASLRGCLQSLCAGARCTTWAVCSELLRGGGRSSTVPTLNAISNASAARRASARPIPGAFCMLDLALFRDVRNFCAVFDLIGRRRRCVKPETP